MKCPICGHAESSVITTDRQEDAVRRRRQCDVCGYRWATVEASAEDWRYRKRVVTLARALAQAISSSGHIYEDPAGTRLTIVLDPPIPPRPGDRKG